jgi:hypothetical protein
MARRHRTKEREIPTAARGAAVAPVDESTQPTGHFRHALLGAAAALLVARPLVPSDGGAWVGDGQIAAALWIALAVLWVVQSLGQPLMRVRFGWIDAAMVAFIGWWSVAALMGSAHAAPRPSINMLWEGVAILLTFLLLRQLVEPDDGHRSGGGCEARALVAVMVAVGVALAITAIYQYFVTMPANRQRFIENPAAMFREAQVEVAPRGTPEFRRFADRLNSPEPIATFSLTNSLAAYLAPWLVISLGIAMFGWRLLPSRPRSRRNWLGIAACAIIIAVALGLTHSRSAWIGTAVGLGCILIWRLSANAREGASTPSPGKAANASPTGKDLHPPSLGLAPPSSARRMVITAIVIAIAGAAAVVVRPQLLQPAKRSFQVRVDYWRATCAMIADRPWFGCGPGNFGDYYTQYKLPAATEEIKDPHDFALEIAVSAGLPALVLLLTVLAGFAYRFRRHAGIGAAVNAPATNDAATNDAATNDAATNDAANEPAASPRPADGVWWVFGGALVGFGVSLIWRKFVGFPAWEDETIGRIVAAGITCWLLWPWVRRGTLPPRLCGLGVLVLLVALLAVGGITFGGVNETLWLLLALGLNATELAPARKSLPWSVNILLLPVVLAVWIAQHQTGYEPVLGCQAALDAARAYGDRGDRPKQEHQLLVAADADPYAAEPRRLLADLRLYEWLHGDKDRHRSGAFTSKLFGDFENWMNQALKLEPQSAPLWTQAGADWRSIYLATKIPADGAKAVEFCRRAVELYPTGVVVQFELADALSATGDLAGAKAGAREALRLDDLRPADERALSDEQRKLAERIISGDNQTVARQSAVPLGPPLPSLPRKAR